ncbi:MAG: hypothetical protein KF778_11605 [Rhodocyclaceae bacterium]|nr:hypothetical protein [Rhodocyclaceae bacterium]MBX3669041.1 hypothetical protein [Rhodocyclaceae bacterium]
MDTLAPAIHRLIAQNTLRDAGLAVRAAIPAGCSNLLAEVSAWLGQLTQVDMQKRTEEVSAGDYTKVRSRLAYRLLDLVSAVEAAGNLAAAP